MSQIYNFNAGPAVLPRSVLEQAQAELLSYQGIGISVLEMSHRSKEFEALNDEAQARLKRLLGVGDDYQVLFVQGGASQQFAMLPLNFLPPGGSADYILTGVWSEKALEEARRIGTARAAGSTAEEQYRRIPGQGELALDSGATYVHITTNNTIYGTQWHHEPAVDGRPLVADMSSDILARPQQATRYALIYAGAQKNIGPSGVTVVVVRKDWLEQAQSSAPVILRYATHAKANSLYNTPPTFGIYLLNLVLGWIEGQGLAALGERNQRKAALIYEAIDSSGGFYRGHAERESRSLMNITFRLPDEALEKRFVAEAQANGMIGLAGHRSVGGIRASVYNAMELEGCQALAEFMASFSRHNG